MLELYNGTFLEFLYGLSIKQDDTIKQENKKKKSWITCIH